MESHTLIKMEGVAGLGSREMERYHGRLCEEPGSWKPAVGKQRAHLDKSKPDAVNAAILGAVFCRIPGGLGVLGWAFFSR